MADITIVNGVYKPTYNWGAPSCGIEWDAKSIEKILVNQTKMAYFTDKNWDGYVIYWVICDSQVGKHNSKKMCVVDTYIVNGACQLTYKWGAPPCTHAIPYTCTHVIPYTCNDCNVLRLENNLGNGSKPISSRIFRRFYHGFTNQLSKKMRFFSPSEFGGPDVQTLGCTLWFTMV